jgi:hypothetical protein
MAQKLFMIIKYHKIGSLLFSSTRLKSKREDDQRPASATLAGLFLLPQAALNLKWNLIQSGWHSLFQEAIDAHGVLHPACQSGRISAGSINFLAISFAASNA